MSKQPITVTCPQCKEVFSIDEALTHQLEEQLRKEYGEEAKQKLREIAEKEKALLKKEQELSETEKLVVQKVQENLVVERQKIQKEAKDEATRSYLKNPNRPQFNAPMMTRMNATQSSTFIFFMVIISFLFCFPMAGDAQSDCTLPHHTTIKERILLSTVYHFFRV